jgi:hypothetical protein
VTRTPTSIGVVVAVVIAIARIVTPADATLTSVAVGKCLAGKIKGTGKATAALLGCSSKDVAQPDAMTLVECRARANDKFDGGGNPAKGVFEKLEAKYPPAESRPCRTYDDTAAIAGDIDAAVSQVGVLVGSDPSGSSCDAAKLKCVGKYIAGVLGCYAKAAGKTGSIAGDCVGKQAAKLSDGSKGCLDKAAGKGDCSAAGSQASPLVTAADAFIAGETCKLDPNNAGCPPPSAPTPTRTATPARTATPTPTRTATPTPLGTATPVTCSVAQPCPGDAQCCSGTCLPPDSFCKRFCANTETECSANADCTCPD